MRFSTSGLFVVALAMSLSSVALAQEADLGVEKTAPAESPADSDVSFVVTLTNLGPDAADGVTLDDPLPPGMTFVSLTQNSGTPFTCSDPGVGNAGTVSCTLAPMAAGDSGTFTIVAHIDAAATPGTFFTNIATATTSGAFDPNEENNAGVANTQTPPPPAADLVVMKSGPPGANPDSNVSYTISVSNGGPSAATDVTITDTLPGTMELVSLTQASGPAMSCTTPAVGAGGTVTCTLASFPASTTASFTLTVHVPADTPDGTTFQNFISVTSQADPNPENDTAVTLLCVQGDSCAAGDCNGFEAVVCAAATSCETQGTCNSATGECAPNIPLPDGDPCDDVDLCTGGSSCQSGVCTGNTPVVCPAAGQCEIRGTCEPSTGVCAPNTDRPDDTACNDGDLCTQTDSCQTGVCVGANPVTCPLPTECQTQGSCSPTTGICATNPPRADGIDCEDNNFCTQQSTCQFGECIGTDPVICPAAWPCEEQGTCNIASGVCAPNVPRADGVDCEDGDACTSGSTCSAGACGGGSAVVCPAAGPCQLQGVCDPGNGACGENLPADDGVSCDDADPCTEGDACLSGSCQGTAVPACVAPDAGVPDAPVAMSDGGVGPVDGGVLVVPDAATRDAPVASADARVLDGGASSDAGAVADARRFDGGTTVTPDDDDGGCGCRAAGGRPSPAGWLVLLAMIGGFRFGRVRRARRRQ